MHLYLVSLWNLAKQLMFFKEEDVLFDIDWQGFQQLKQSGKSLEYLFTNKRIDQKTKKKRQGYF